MLRILRGLLIWVVYLIAQLALVVAAYPLHVLAVVVVLIVQISQGAGATIGLLLFTAAVAFFIHRVVPGAGRALRHGLRGWSRMVMGLRSLHGPDFGADVASRRRGFGAGIRGTGSHIFKEQETNRHEA